MQSHHRLIIGTLAGVIIGVTTSLSVNVFAFKQTTSDNNGLPIDELKKFSEVYARIKQDYVEEIDEKEVMSNAIRGMLNGLDPHSNYLDEQDFKDLQISTSGEFGGLGIEVGMEDGFVKVISPIDDTPAARAGLKAGDLIIRLDSKAVKGMSLNDAVKVMRGKPGSDIELLVVREGKDKPLKITITRDVIKVKSVKQRLLEEGYGYLRITSFQSKTTENVFKALEKLEKENGEALKGLVLDLRNNPGGVLGAAVGVSDAFLDAGKIVYTEGRIADSKMEYNAKKGDELDGRPIVILVNQGSASASEIVAGALQDHKRAIVVGRKTFGKGSVQTVLPLDSQTAVKLTTARYFTPLGRSIQAEGIKPDIEVKTLDINNDSKEKDDIKPLSEADFDKHLSNPTIDDEEKTDKKDSEKPDDSSDAEKDDKPEIKKGEAKDKNLAKEDYQLYEALNILKGMSLIYGRTK